MRMSCKVLSHLQFLREISWTKSSHSNRNPYKWGFRPKKSSLHRFRLCSSWSHELTVLTYRKLPGLIVTPVWAVLHTSQYRPIFSTAQTLLVVTLTDKSQIRETLQGPNNRHSPWPGNEALETSANQDPSNSSIQPRRGLVCITSPRANSPETNSQ